MDESALQSVTVDVSGIVVFRALLNDNEVTVSIKVFTKVPRSRCDIPYADRRELVWHDKLDKCVATIKSWD